MNDLKFFTDKLTGQKKQTVVIGGAYTDKVANNVAKQPVGLAHQLEQGAKKRLQF